MSELAKQTLKVLFLQELNLGKTKKDLMIFDCPELKFKDCEVLHEIYIDYCIRKKELVDLIHFQRYLWEELKDEKIKEIYIKHLAGKLIEDK